MKEIEHSCFSCFVSVFVVVVFVCMYTWMSLFKPENSPMYYSLGMLYILFEKEPLTGLAVV